MSSIHEREHQEGIPQQDNRRKLSARRESLHHSSAIFTNPTFLEVAAAKIFVVPTPASNPDDTLFLTIYGNYNPKNPAPIPFRQFPRSPITLGSNPDNDVVLEEPSVSQNHAVISASPQEYTIADDSTQGTVAHELRELKDTDRLLVNREESIIFVLGEAPIYIRTSAGIYSLSINSDQRVLLNGELANADTDSTSPYVLSFATDGKATIQQPEEIVSQPEAQIITRGNVLEVINWTNQQGIGLITKKSYEAWETEHMAEYLGERVRTEGAGYLKAAFPSKVNPEILKPEHIIKGLQPGFGHDTGAGFAKGKDISTDNLVQLTNLFRPLLSAGQEAREHANVWIIANHTPPRREGIVGYKTGLLGKSIPVKGKVYQSVDGFSGEHGWVIYNFGGSSIYTERFPHIEKNMGFEAKFIVPPETARQINEQVAIDPRFPRMLVAHIWPGLLGDKQDSQIRLEPVQKLIIYDYTNDPLGTKAIRDEHFYKQ